MVNCKRCDKEITQDLVFHEYCLTCYVQRPFWIIKDKIGPEKFGKLMKSGVDSDECVEIIEELEEAFEKEFSEKLIEKYGEEVI